MHILEEVRMTRLCNGSFVAEDQTTEIPVSPFLFEFSVVDPPEVILRNRRKKGFYDGQIEFTFNFTDEISDEEDRDTIRVDVYVGPINPGYNAARLELFGPELDYILKGTSEEYLDKYIDEEALNPDRSRLEIIEALLEKNMTPELSQQVSERIYGRIMAGLPSFSLTSEFEID
jgi:hypothetical protein